MNLSQAKHGAVMALTRSMAARAHDAVADADVVLFTTPLKTPTPTASSPLKPSPRRILPTPSPRKLGSPASEFVCCKCKNTDSLREVYIKNTLAMLNEMVQSLDLIFNDIQQKN